MSNVHFPIYMLLCLLLGSVLSPIFEKRIKTLLFTSMLGAWCFSAANVMAVFHRGPFSYFFGRWSASIGIEFAVNELSSLMSFFMISMAGLILMFAQKDMEHEIDQSGIPRYYTLVFVLLFAMQGILFANDMFNMYVFLEISSISACGLVSIKAKRENYLAAFRYLLLGTIGSLSVLLGIALLYMVSGDLNMTRLNVVIIDIWQEYPTNIIVALAFIVTGLGIKSAIFPMHTWLPDAHASAPSPSSALLSGLVVKVSIIAMMKIMFVVVGKPIVAALNIPSFLSFFAAVGMIMGSIFAIGQKDVKRLLAYSSVAQLGYIMLGISLATRAGTAAALFHVVAHGMMKIALFLCAGAILYRKNKRLVQEFDGLFYEMPITMTVFSIAALGMIGIPGIIGFMSKVYLSMAVMEIGQPIFLVVIIISSFLNAFYYLPILIAAFLKENPLGIKTARIEALPWSMTVPMVVLGLLCLVFGFYPTLAMRLIERAVLFFII